METIQEINENTMYLNAIMISNITMADGTQVTEDAGIGIMHKGWPS